MKSTFLLSILALGAYAAPGPYTTDDGFRNCTDQTNTTCWNVWRPRETTAECRPNCSSTIDMINCLTVAGHITSVEEDAPRIAGNGYPFFGNTSNLNDASLACYKNNIFPSSENTSPAFSAMINLVASGREDATKSVNRDLPRISSLCEKVGVSVKYTSVVVNGAMTATAGSILLAFGVAVASFL